MNLCFGYCSDLDVNSGQNFKRIKNHVKGNFGGLVICSWVKKPTKYGQNGIVFQNCQCMPAGFQFLKKIQTTIVILL